LECDFKTYGNLKICRDTYLEKETIFYYLFVYRKVPAVISVDFLTI
jgi:hypothetical protein